MVLNDAKIAEALASAAKAQLEVLESISGYLANRRDEAPAQITSAPYVTIPLASAMTGLSAKAIRRKIEEGKWIEGQEYRRSPDGGIFISIKGFERWVERGT